MRAAFFVAFFFVAFLAAFFFLAICVSSWDEFATSCSPLLLLIQFNQVTPSVNSKFAKKHIFCFRMLMEVGVSAVSFLIPAFGILSVMRMSRIFRERAVISTSLVTKTGTITCASAILSGIFAKSHPISAIVGPIAIIATAFSALWIIERRQIDALKSEMPVFFDRWILDLKLGHSLSAARTAALRASSENLRALLEPVFLSRERAHEFHPLIDAALMRELTELMRGAGSSLGRLENMRMSLRKWHTFRRKSGQARRQTAIQAAVLLILQVALAAFTIFRHGWGRSFDLVIWSFLLSGVGFMLMHALSRKKSWNL